MKRAIFSEDVSFTYLHGDEPTLKEINLKVAPGECILVCGASGSGKSTLSRLLNGISPNYVEGELDGSLHVNGLVAGEADLEEYVPVVGSVFQNSKTQHFTVDTTSELAFPLENLGKDPAFIQEQVTRKAQEFQIDRLLDRNIFELSGGEKQQIAFTAANMLEPEVLVLDEVTSNLDQGAILRIRDMVARLKEQGMTIVILEHRLAWAKDLADRYVLFENGRIVNDWTAEEFMQFSNQDLHEMGLRSMDLSEHQQLIEEKLNQTNDFTSASLRTEHLSIGYSNRDVLEDLNLGFHGGQVTGLLGPNGTGKSTLGNTLTGLQNPLSGKVLWNGQSITKNHLLKKSYLVMQDMNYQLFTDSVLEEVLLGAKYPEYADSVIEQLNLTEFKERHPMSLSEGQKQRVAIASAIISGKEIIVFDEPTSGLDYLHMERFGKLLDDLKKTDAVIIVITHDEELASVWCDSIIDLSKR